MRDLVATCRGEWPKTSMCPLVGYNSPSNILTVVDLPEPLGPRRPKTSPRRTSKSTLSTARALGRPQKSLKILVKPRTATTPGAEAISVAGTIGAADRTCSKAVGAVIATVQASLGVICAPGAAEGGWLAGASTAGRCGSNSS